MEKNRENRENIGLKIRAIILSNSDFY